MSELCLKDETVLTLKDVEGVPSDIQKIVNPELLPICLKNDCTMENLKKWFKNRSMPENREGLDKVKAEFGDKWMVNKNYASLSDHYWLKKRSEKWSRINFFTNNYTKDIGDMFFRPWVVNKRIDSFSPDLTTNGVLMKRWIQYSDKTSALIKAASVATKQEPLNEVLVAVLIEQLGIELVKSAGYDFYVEGTTMCSISNNFVTLDTELVPASYVYYQEKRGDDEEIYEHLVKMCEKNDIPNAEEFINWIIFIDTLTGNEDRTLSNIGFLMDVNTRKFIGPAPVFDCGNAYWNTKTINAEIKNKLWGNLSNTITKKMKKKCDCNVLLNDKAYKKTIWNYPCITDVKKENLCNAIEKRNKELVTNINLLEHDR